MSEPEKAGQSGIVKELSGNRGRFVLSRNGEEAEITFLVTGPDQITAVHTGVPESFKGTGAGRLLIEAMVADARAEGYSVVPRCPFVRAQALRHPEWQDVILARPQAEGSEQEPRG